MRKTLIDLLNKLLPTLMAIFMLVVTMCLWWIVLGEFGIVISLFSLLGLVLFYGQNDEDN